MDYFHHFLRTIPGVLGKPVDLGDGAPPTSMMEYLGSNSLGRARTSEAVITGPNMPNPPKLPAIYENP